MRKGCNPKGHRGYRNLYCTDYNSCLDLAIARSWNSWCCTKCEYRFAEYAEKRNLSASGDEIVEYGLIIQPVMLDDALLANNLNNEYDVATIY